MEIEHYHDNGTMSRQKISINPEETLKECRDISIDCCNKTKGRMKKECRDIAKFVTTKARKSSQKFFAIIVFMSRQNLPRSAIHGKERMSRQLKLCRDDYCDNPKIRGPLINHQPAKDLWISYDPIPHICVPFIGTHHFTIRQSPCGCCVT